MLLQILDFREMDQTYLTFIVPGYRTIFNMVRLEFNVSYLGLTRTFSADGTLLKVVLNACTRVVLYRASCTNA